MKLLELRKKMFDVLIAGDNKNHFEWYGCIKV